MDWKHGYFAETGYTYAEESSGYASVARLTPTETGAHRYWRWQRKYTITGLTFLKAHSLYGWYLYECVADDPTPPPSGVWVFRDVPTPTPDGTTTTFTTTYPFIDGSLEVFVDRLDQTPAVLSYDGAARTFTLGFAPQVGELVECNYQSR